MNFSESYKFKCGCKIHEGSTDAKFLITLCDHHRGRISVAAASLEQIYKRILDDTRVRMCKQCKTLFSSREEHRNHKKTAHSY